jgi:histidyl-tRNA synthetase
MVVEAELCAAVSDVLVQLGFNDFTIRLNHRKILEGILDHVIMIPAEQHSDVLTAIDKLDKIGRDGVTNELAARGINERAVDAFFMFYDSTQGAIETGKRIPDNWNAFILERLSDFLGTHNAGMQGLDDLQRIIEYTAEQSSAAHLIIDPNLARGLSYYTGVIMEINVPDLAGSLGGGGRYDNLVGMFSGQDVPACGFSLGLERIIVVMTERGMFPPALTEAPADVMVTVWNEESIVDSLQLATELRAEGLRVDLYPEADKLGKQFKYASARGIAFVAVVGAEEKARGEVALKDMRSGEQRTLPRESVAATIKTEITAETQRRRDT